MLTVPSFAKINWTLEILGKRADGYHEVRTILQTIDLADTLTFEVTRDGVEIECDTPGFPLYDSNLISRAFHLFRNLTRISGGVRVIVEKRIPMAAGLGGGSSNAAITLLALSRLFSYQLELRHLIELGRELGADVPFFFQGGRALGIGRGDEVYPLEDIEAGSILLVNCGLHVGTHEAYGLLGSPLTRHDSNVIMPFSLEAAYAGLWRSRVGRSALRNDLEAVVFSRYPLLNEVKHRLLGAGASSVVMSGSGSTVFALFDSEATLSVASEELSRSGWWCAPVKPLGRTEYLKNLGALEKPDID
jgi:4-diphosphocytidyl-2-C-methyl-D-erythritol kinase